METNVLERRFKEMRVLIGSGTGRGLWKCDYILEPKMFAAARKKSG